MLKLKKAIYRVPDAGDNWEVTVHGHVKGDLKLIPLVGDPSLYRKPNNKDGLMAVYVDDKAMCGNEEMRKTTEISLKTFQSKPRDWDEFDFFGTHLHSLGSSAFSIDQASYIDCLKPIPMDCPFDQFRSHHAMFAWVGLTCPDMSCFINRAAQFTQKTFSVAKVKDVNDGIKYMKGSVHRCLVFKKLDKASLHLRVYTDASFGNNDDLSSQLGFVIFLCDDSKACHILHYPSKKSKPVVRSVLGGEVYAFAEGHDRAFIMHHDLEAIYKCEISLLMLMDSKQMFDVITKSSSTTEKRLMIDIVAAREAYERQEISNVGFVLSEHNVAHSLTKAKPNGSLEKIMEIGIDDNPVQRWIFRIEGSS